MVSYVKHDLEFILAQIKISEAHADATNGGGDLEASRQALLDLLPNGLEPLGVRTVDGTLNNLVPGQSTFGAANTTFPTLVDPVFSNDADGDQFDINGPGPGGLLTNTNYGLSGNVVDSDPRTISNLVVDQSVNNPAAVARAEYDPGADGLYGTADDVGSTNGSSIIDPDGIGGNGNEFFVIPNVAPDEGLSAPFNSWMTLFGQFFDHGLDLINKGGNGTVYIPLQPDDPLYVEGAPTNFMVLTRATTGAGAGNDTTSFVDQNQTYASHPSHQVFLREYVLNAAGDPVATGALIQGVNGGMATWGDVKAQALNILGIALDDGDIDVPLVATDQYGNFIPGANGFPQIVTATGLIEGSVGAPVDASLAVRTGHVFLADIARNAEPGTTFDHDNNPATPRIAVTADADDVAGNTIATDSQGSKVAYDDELLDAHFIAGDGRANENFGLTAVHHVFHSEHNRLVEHTKEVILESGDLAFLNEWLSADVTAIPADPSNLQWDGERLFQAAKFGTEMQYQHLVFEEFARKVQPLINIFGPYDATIDPSIVSEFANTVYRFGHSMLNETVDLMDPDGNLTEVGLIQAFLNPLGFNQSVLADGTVDPTVAYDPEAAAGAIIRGMTRQTGNEIDEFVTDALRNNLLGLPLDLAAINLARGRDTGVPTLNEARADFYAGTSDTKLKPYESWFDFAMNLKNEMSIVNFIAAYGTHQLILDADTTADKRDAAMKLVFGDATLTDPAAIAAFDLDRLAFLNATGTYAGGTLGGLNNVDLWIGGLAEAIEPFGGMLGSTFNFVFEEQMERLQDADRFYYLDRTAGLNFLTQLEQNSFASIIMKNTDLGVDQNDVTDFTTHLPGDIFSSPNFVFESNVELQQDYNGAAAGKDPSGDSILIPLVIRVDANNDGIAEKLQFTGGEHVVLGGTNFDDHLIGGIGDDTLWGDGGNDRLEGGNGADILLGGAGDDIITDSGGPGPDNLQGQDGNDVISAGPGEALILAGAGKDYVLAGINLKETFGGEGDDFINAGDDANIVFAGEGDDWIEGGEGNDLLQGDNGDPFQTSTIIGNDVIIGGGGNDDYDAESGDDIMLGSPGTERHEGMLGFDWATFKDDPFGIEVDMTLRAFDERPIPPSNESVLDRFDSVEGLSGSSRADILRGDNRVATEFDAGPTPGVPDNVLRNFDLISGLRGTTTNAAFISDALFDSDVTEWGEGEIILGGDGSDIIEGRGGNDLIDGDLWLNVRIAVRDPITGAELGSVDSMQGLFTSANTTVAAWQGKHLNELMFDGTINPGNLHIVREILNDTTNNVAGTAGYDGDFDTVVYSGLRAEYTIETLADGVTFGDGNSDGYITVSHNDAVLGAGLGADGVDNVRNVERLRFSDQTVPLVAGANAEPVGAPTISDTTPSIGQTLTVSLAGVTDADNTASGGAITGPSVIFWQVEEDPGTGVFSDIIIIDPASDEEIPVTGASFVVTPELDGLALRVRVLYQDQGGVLEEVTSAATSLIAPAPVAGTGATAGDDILVGTTGADIIDGLGGADTIDGLAGNDTLIGGAGADIITGGAGVDAITGDGGADRLSGDAGVDTISGGAGLDTILGGDGADTLTGEGGDDDINGELGADTISGGAGNDELFGDAGADTINGNADNDIIDGGLGADRLFGDAGIDILIGGGGVDELNGGAGNDELTGGAGVDMFIFGANFGADTITDFDDIGGGQDIIDLVAFNIAFANLTINQVGADAIITSTAFGLSSITVENINAANLQADDFTF